MSVQEGRILVMWGWWLLGAHLQSKMLVAMLRTANQTRMPWLCFLNPGWVLFSRGRVKAAQSIMPGYWPCRAVGLPGSPASACCVAAQPCRGGRPCLHLSVMTGRERGWQMLLEWDSDWSCFWKGKNLQPFGGGTKCSLDPLGLWEPKLQPRTAELWKELSEERTSWFPAVSEGPVPHIHRRASSLTLWCSTSVARGSHLSVSQNQGSLRDVVGTSLPTHLSVREEESLA